jgi:hypothetical protein
MKFDRKPGVPPACSRSRWSRNARPRGCASRFSALARHARAFHGLGSSGFCLVELTRCAHERTQATVLETRDDLATAAASSDASNVTVPWANPQMETSCRKIFVLTTSATSGPPLRPSNVQGHSVAHRPRSNPRSPFSKPAGAITPTIKNHTLIKTRSEIRNALCDGRQGNCPRY